MSELLFVLFLLFSIVSALLERRKRAKALEEAQQQDDDRRKRGFTDDPTSAPVAVDDEDDDEEWGGWPFPGGGDPFEQPRPQTAPVRTQKQAAPTGASDVDVLVSDQGPMPTRDMQSALAESERRSRDAERRAAAEQELAAQTAQQARQVTQSSRRVAELMRQRLAATKPVTKKRTRKRWHMTSATARRAVVYAEIVGPCKAQQDDSQDRWSS